MGDQMVKKLSEMKEEELVAAMDREHEAGADELSWPSASGHYTLALLYQNALILKQLQAMV